MSALSDFILPGVSWKTIDDNIIPVLERVLRRNVRVEPKVA